MAALPTSAVTVTLSSGDTGALAVPASFVFTTSNWNQPRTVTVRGVQDYDRDDETVTVTHRSSGGGYGPVSGTVTVTVVDDDVLPPGYVLSPQQLSVDEGDTATYTLRLATEPTGAVTVALSSGDTGALAVPVSFVFTNRNWYQPRTVTVRGVEDDDTADETVTVTHRSSGGGFGPLTGTVTVTVVDDDTLPPALVLSPQQLTVGEGDTATYTLSLATQPTAAVTVTVSSGDTGALAVPASFVFTASNWNQPRTVTVRGVDDNDTSDETVTVTHDASRGGYGGVTGTVTVTVIDDDTLPPGLLFTPQRFDVDEGDTATYRLSLAALPTGPVTVAVSSGDTGALAVPVSFVFTASNWNQPRTVTVRGVRGRRPRRRDGDGHAPRVGRRLRVGDRDGDGDRDRRRHAAAGSVVHAAAFRRRRGRHRDLPAELAALPTGPVTVAVSSGDTGALAVPVSFVFTASNWNQPRTVTVRGVEDGDRDDETVAVTHRASGGGYGSVTGTVTVTVIDDDTLPPGLLFTPQRFDVGEGDTATYRLSLAAQPTAPVTVAVTSGDTGALAVPVSFVFTASNWNQPRTVTVRGVEDGDRDDETVAVTHRASGGGYGSVTGHGDGDGDRRRHAAAGSVVHAAALRRRRGRHRDLPAEFGGAADRSGDGGGVLGRHGGAGGAGEFRVHRLELEPAPHGDGARRRGRRPRRRDGGGHAPRVGRRLRVGDGHGDGDGDRRRHAAAGSAVHAAALRRRRGRHRDLPAEPGALPTAPVTVAVTSGDTGALAVPVSFVFTASNWNQPRTVTVRGVEDGDRDDETVAVTHRASGGGYGSVTGTVTVTVIDDDTLPPGLLFTPQRFDVDEGDTATYRLSLAALPTGPVTVAVSSGDTGALAVPVSFVFTASNWNQPRTVTVRGVEDGDRDDETVAVTHRASGGGYGSVTGTVTVTVIDDDTLPPGLLFTPQRFDVDEGDTATYRLSLAAQPTAPVTVAVTSGDTGRWRCR